MRLEKLIMTNLISFFFTETFDLLSSGQFENLVFRPESQGGKFLQALSLWVRCRRLFFSAKKAPIFLQALSFWVRCLGGSTTFAEPALRVPRSSPSSQASPAPFRVDPRIPQFRVPHPQPHPAV